MPLIKLLLLPIFVLLGLGFPSDNSYKKPIATAKPALKQEFFNYIRCHRQAKNIVINWGVNSIAGINKFVIYYSDDGGEFFNPLPGDIFPDGSLKYTFKHESV